MAACPDLQLNILRKEGRKTTPRQTSNLGSKKEGKGTRCVARTQLPRSVMGKAVSQRGGRKEPAKRKTKPKNHYRR